MTLDVAALRAQVPGLDATVYLNTGGFGMMPEASRREIVEGYEALGIKIDTLAWFYRTFERAKEVRAQIARFVGADADEIALKASVTDGYGSVLWGFDWKPGDRVIVSREEHGSPRGAVELAARRFGFEVVALPIHPMSRFMEGLRAELAKGARLVAISHVTTDTGTAFPIAEVSRLAQEVGARVLLDGAQAFGQMPLDLHAEGVDFYASMGYKWALGPYGAGFLYVRRDRQSELMSVFGSSGTTWTDLPSGEFEEVDTAQRFEFMLKSFPQFDALSRSLQLLKGIGVVDVQAWSAELTKRFRAGLREVPGARVYTPEDQPPLGIVTFGIEGVGGRDISTQLRERWNVVQRAAMMAGGPEGPEGGVRISLAAYNTPEEVDLLLGAVRQIARENAPVPAR